MRRPVQKKAMQKKAVRAGSQGKKAGNVKRRTTRARTPQGRSRHK